MGYCRRAGIAPRRLTDMRETIVNKAMQDIDFLPSDFKRRRTNRHGRSWQLVVVGAAAGLLLVVAVGQSRALRQVEQRLADIEPQRQQLAERKALLANLQTELAEREAQAELIAYLGHPWPKTQLLAATLKSLPEEVVYESVRISREHEPGPTRRGGDGGDEEEDIAKLQPATRDLRLLQQECDTATVTVILEGTTVDGIKLYRYLHQLNDVPLFSKVELQSLESMNDEADAKFRFEARLAVRPGFGQPNGPDGHSRQVVHANPRGRETVP